MTTLDANKFALVLDMAQTNLNEHRQEMDQPAHNECRDALIHARLWFNEELDRQMQGVTGE